MSKVILKNNKPFKRQSPQDFSNDNPASLGLFRLG